MVYIDSVEDRDNIVLGEGGVQPRDHISETFKG